MFRRNNLCFKKYSLILLSLCTAGILGACGQNPGQAPEQETVESQITINISGSDNPQTDGESEETSVQTAQEESLSVQTSSQTDSKVQDMTARFGESCIAEQTFEVELSEYSGSVYFVPFSPSDNRDFHMQIIQHDNILADINGYVPVGLTGQPFTSLDAVSFYDINYDGYTDIILVETYGSTAFAAVYYGFDAKADDYEKYFIVQEHLSDVISSQTSPLTISQIRTLLSGGKRNGEFSSYKEAYQAVGRLTTLAETTEQQYSLIYVDDDDIPELAAGLNGYYTSLYTYSDGKVYTLMNQWPYGAMGNSGYEYSPRKNNLRNYNSDYAGIILYTTYMTITDSHSLDVTAQIKTCLFDDVNENGIPDEDETESFGRYAVSYLNGVEVSPQECAAYDAGEYEFIIGTMTLDALLSELNQ